MPSPPQTQMPYPSPSHPPTASLYASLPPLPPLISDLRRASFDIPDFDIWYAPHWPNPLKCCHPILGPQKRTCKKPKKAPNKSTMRFAHATHPQRPARDNLVGPSFHHFRQRGSLSREIQIATRSKLHVPRRSAAQSALRSRTGLLGRRSWSVGEDLRWLSQGRGGVLVVRDRRGGGRRVWR